MEAAPFTGGVAHPASTTAAAFSSAQVPNNNAPFNPQSLGREFVRQYYTVLNQGPHILHR